MKFAELRTVGDIPPILAALVLVVLAAAVCTGGSGAQTTGGVHEDEIMNLAHAYNAFGFDLYANVLGGYPSENVFISPTSIAMALAMTLGGAGGTTEEAMLRVM
ncbi:MAG TPA: serpin family protein, partial [Patescibacteria group bacterium]|nr:serpin family protein [Patescibacteria group bacterium]